MLIGLSGKRQSGKDTLAAALVDRHGFTRVAFADQLKAMLYVQNPLVLLDDDKSLYRLAQLVDLVGWDTAKANADVRQLLQRAGQWVFTVDKMFWVKAALATVPEGAPGIIVTDVRFDHELAWLRSAAGLLVRVERSGHVITDTDPSETVADAWDYDFTVLNAGPGVSSPAALADELIRWARP